ncbi:MAG: glycosyltransferase [Pseudomonadota bacterium]
MRVFIWVQHLRGIGHIMRALAIARALQNAGATVRVATGNTPPAVANAAGIDVIELPPCRASDDTIQTLVDARGAPINDTWWEERADALAATFHAFQPDILVTECYPFGRRPFRRELQPLIDAMHTKNGLVVASLRDILQRVSRPKKAKWMVERASEFHKFCVHGHRELATLESALPTEDVTFENVIYTGFVHDRPLSEATEESSEIIVSVGGGAMGETLLSVVPDAIVEAPQEWRWRVLHGALAPTDIVAQLRAIDRQTVTIETARPDFPALLNSAACSVSLCGYNTAMDVLTSGVPSVMVPFDDAGQTEQNQRASALAKLGRVTMIEPASLTPERLVAAIKDAKEKPIPDLPFQFDGAERTAKILFDLFERHHG